MANAITARHFQDVYDVFNYNSHNWSLRYDNVFSF
jgi:hypothetical protein